MPDESEEDSSPDYGPYHLRVLGTRPPSPGRELSAASRFSGPLKPQAITVLMPQFGTWRPPTPNLLVIYSSKQTLGAYVSAAGC